MDATTSEQKREQRKLRSIQLQPITTRTLLENKALLVEIRDLLREQSRHRNGIDLTIFPHSRPNGAPNQRHLEHRIKSRIHKTKNKESKTCI